MSNMTIKAIEHREKVTRGEPEPKPEKPKTEKAEKSEKDEDGGDTEGKS